MKTIIKLLFPLFSGFLLYSCGGNGNKNATSTNFADSAVNIVDTIVAPFSTPDLSLFDLRGNVSEIELVSTPALFPQISGLEFPRVVFTFDENGILLSEGPLKMKREDDIIRKLEFDSEENTLCWEYDYENGRLVAVRYSGIDGDGKISIEYDDDGFPSQYTDRMEGEGALYIIRSKVKEVEKDDAGNWTSLLIEEEATEYNEVGTVQNSIKRTRKEERKIKYSD